MNRFKKSRRRATTRCRRLLSKAGILARIRSTQHQKPSANRDIIMAQPVKIAVVGGGISGTLCSLVLKNRGIHPTLIDAGRTAMGGRLRHQGAQFLRAADPRLATVVDMLDSHGLVKRWDGRFGMLGSVGGGFLPAEIVAQTTGYKSSKDDEQEPATPASDGGDFCKFVANSQLPPYVGIPSMADLCPRICSLAGIEQVNNSRFIGATPSSSGWKLEVEQDIQNERPIEMTETFDALVIATHDPSIASSVVRSIVDAEIIEGGYANLDEALKNSNEDASIVINRLMEISNAMQLVRDKGKQPVYAVSMTFPKVLSQNIPFDAVSIPGSSIVQFLSRDASKPGGSNPSERVETWTAVSTSAMAEHILSRDGDDDQKLSEAAFLVSNEVSKLLANYRVGEGTEPLDVSAKRWNAAFCSSGLGLKEDSIFLAPWRLAVCGDYIRDLTGHATPLEAAALSGLEAGERTSALWTTQISETQN